MSKGGIILSRDYANLPRVYKVFNEFLARKSEPIIEMSSNLVQVTRK